MTTKPLTSSADFVPEEVLYRSQKTLISRHVSPRSGRHVVFKQALGTQAHERLRHESDILQRLRGIAGVVQLADAPTPPNTLALQDEGGVPLHQLLQTHTLSSLEVVRLGLALAHILTAVHGAGVIHKDINPSNVLVHGPDHQPTLIDFNIASDVAQEVLGFTHQSQIAGTLRYMAPEQTGRTGRSVDQRADLYSLGVLLYELTAGRPPFEGEDLLDLIHDHLARTPATPFELQPQTPPMLSSLIMHLLEKEPDRRYQSAEGLAQDLARLQTALLTGDTTPFAFGQDDFPRRLSPPARPIGRETEIAYLQATLERAITGQTRCLLVGGAPGVGKTTLINELRTMVSARRGWFATGKFDQYRKDTASATVQALRALGRLLLAEPEEQLASYRTRILQGLGNNAGFGAALLPEFALLLGPQPGVEVSDPREAAIRINQTTVDLLRSIASPEQPVVLVIDDLQWAPSITLAFLETLVTATQGIPGLLVVGCYRANEVGATHPLATAVTHWGQLGLAPAQLNLDKLPEADISTLLATMLRLAPHAASQLAQALFEHSEGNPYDTVELINALRQDGLLKTSEGQWHWDATAIHQYVGHTGVVDILNRRISKLPQTAHDLLELMACLGGEVDANVLALGSGLPPEQLTLGLAPALADGLLLTERGQTTMLHFRHDRVQQAVFEGMTPELRRQRHLSLARQLAPVALLSQLCAEQYLPVASALVEEDECRQVVHLFQAAAARANVVNSLVTERFLAAALGLLKRFSTPADTPLLLALEIAQHAALYSLGRLEEGDAVYASIVARTDDPVTLTSPVGIQIYSLTNRRRHNEAVALGLQWLGELGLPKPDDPQPAIAANLQRLVQWHKGEEKLLDFSRPEPTDPRAIARATLILQTTNASYFVNPTVFSWLILEGHRLWVEDGPSSQLMASVSGLPYLMIGATRDYRGAYVVARHMIAVGEARAYAHGTELMRTSYGVGAGHWGAPIEQVIRDLHRARERLMQMGDLVFAGYTYEAADMLLDSAPLADVAAEWQAGLALSDRTRQADLRLRYLPRHQLMQALLGKTVAPGSLSDGTFDEAAYLKDLPSPGILAALFHVMRTIASAIFDDAPALAHSAALATSMLARLPGFYITAIANALQAVSLANQARALALEERAPLLEKIDRTCLHWLTQRAKDMPVNFLHLQHWVEAERAWAAGDNWQAVAKFDLALQTATQVNRPWHQALITERTGLFHQSHGMDKDAQRLITQACSLYETWGATGKVQAMQAKYIYLRRDTDLRRVPLRIHSDTVTATNMNTDSVDMLAVLRASQALSSETNLTQLTVRLSDVLGTMTGASAVHLLVKPADQHDWFMAQSLAGEAQTLSVEQAGQQRLLALSVFRYAQRTGETLLLEDATQDDRFRRDAYFSALDQCSLLCVPVLSHGELRAMLMLENRQHRGAFSAERLDAVRLIAGQMAVSLDNALLYASLEARVQQRTEKLAQALQTLERTKDELVRSEKLAALGSLVAGVAHELNTPIGNGLTVASTLDFRVAEFTQLLTTALKRSVLEQFVADTKLAAEILVRTLGRAAELVRSFKQVAIDQTSAQQRTFELHEVVSEILLTLGPSIRHSRCTVTSDIDPQIKLDSYPGPLGQVLTNLIDNAMLHGYGEGNSGVIDIEARSCSPTEFELKVRDKGRGVESHNLQRIFEPFYTTRLGQGGSGLGLHIVHNIVNSVLGGKIEVTSTPGTGTEFVLRLPLEAPQTEHSRTSPLQQIHR